jgi:hypothetical protein
MAGASNIPEPMQIPDGDSSQGREKEKWSRGPAGPEPRMTVLAKPSSNLPETESHYLNFSQFQVSWLLRHKMKMTEDKRGKKREEHLEISGGGFNAKCKPF